MTDLLRWSEKSPVLAAQIGSIAETVLTPDPLLGARHDERQNGGYMHPSYIDLVLRTIALEQTGSDKRYRQIPAVPAVPGDPGTPEIPADSVEQNIAWVRMVIQLYCETLESSEQLASQGILANIGARIRRESAREAFKAVGLSLTNVGQATPVQINDDGHGRQVNAMTLDLSFNGVTLDEDLSTIGGWIQAVTIVGEFGHGGEPDHEYTEEVEQ